MKLVKHKPQVVERILDLIETGIRKKSYSSRMFLQAGPLRRPKNDELVWSIETGFYTFSITANPKIGLPWGVYYRMIQIWIDTQIIFGNLEKTNSGYMINLGTSLRKWLKSIGLDTNKKTMDAVQDQWKRFITSQFLLEKRDSLSPQGDKKVFYMPVASKAVFWDERKHHEGEEGEFHSYVILNADYVEWVKEKRAIPLDDRILSALRESAFAIDFYRWLTYRAAAGRKLVIETSDLLREFGVDPQNTKYRRMLEQYLLRIQAFWQVKARFEKGTRGKSPKFVLEVSPPSVERRAIPEPVKK